MPRLVRSHPALKNQGETTAVASHRCCVQLKRKLNNQTILLLYSTFSLESFLWTLVKYVKHSELM
jgi:hypothetical protein